MIKVREWSRIYICMYGQHVYLAEYGPTRYGCQSHVVSLTGKTLLFPQAPFALENLVSRDGFWPSHTALARLLSILTLDLVLTHGISPAFRDDVHSFIESTTIEPVPGLLCHAIAYQWCSLSRVRRRRGHNLRVNPSNGCCLFRHHHGPFFGMPLFSHIHY